MKKTVNESKQAYSNNKEETQPSPTGFTKLLILISSVLAFLALAFGYEYYEACQRGYGRNMPFVCLIIIFSLYLLLAVIYAVNKRTSKQRIQRGKTSKAIPETKINTASEKTESRFMTFVSNHWWKLLIIVLITAIIYFYFAFFDYSVKNTNTGTLHLDPLCPHVHTISPENAVHADCYRGIDCETCSTSFSFWFYLRPFAVLISFGIITYGILLLSQTFEKYRKYLKEKNRNIKLKEAKERLIMFGTAEDEDNDKKDDIFPVRLISLCLLSAAVFAYLFKLSAAVFSCLFRLYRIIGGISLFAAFLIVFILAVILDKIAVKNLHQRIKALKEENILIRNEIKEIKQ